VGEWCGEENTKEFWIKGELKMIAAMYGNTQQDAVGIACYGSKVVTHVDTQIKKTTEERAKRRRERSQRKSKAYAALCEDDGT
jgi:hypothetical protein